MTKWCRQVDRMAITSRAERNGFMEIITDFGLRLLSHSQIFKCALFSPSLSRPVFLAEKHKEEGVAAWSAVSCDPNNITDELSHCRLWFQLFYNLLPVSWRGLVFLHWLCCTGTVGNWMIRVSKTKKNTKHLQCILMSSGKLSENQQPRRGFVWQNKHCVFLIIFIFQVTENTASLLEIDMVIMTSPMGWL